MNGSPLLRTLGVLAICLGAAACSRDLPGADCTKSAVDEGVRTWLRGLADYQLTSEVSLEGTRVVAQIMGRPPDRLRVELALEGPSGPITELAVFDGEYQWLETRSGGFVQVRRLELARLTDARRPFDTSLYLMGTGLLNGEDLPATVATLLAVFDWEVEECSPEALRLAGPMKLEAFRGYASSRSTLSSDALLSKFSQQFGFLRMRLDPAQHAVQGYSLGPDANQSGITVAFSNLVSGQELRPESFAYAPPEGTTVEDVTEEVLESRKSPE